MNFKLICASVVGLGIGMAIAATTPAFQLRGDRFKPLTYEQMTPEQKTMTDHVLAGDRGSMNGPYNVLLRSPEMGDLAQKYGAYMRFHSSIPHKLNELAILITARFWNSQYEWYAHHQYALKAGLSPAVIDAVAAGRQPTSMQPDEEIVYNFCHELLNARHVSDAHFKAAVDRFGERGVVDLIGVMGYYHLVSMALNVDRYPLPAGGKPELGHSPHKLSSRAKRLAMIPLETSWRRPASSELVFIQEVRLPLFPGKHLPMPEGLAMTLAANSHDAWRCLSSPSSSRRTRTFSPPSRRVRWMLFSRMRHPIELAMWISRLRFCESGKAVWCPPAAPSSASRTWMSKAFGWA